LGRGLAAGVPGGDGTSPHVMCVALLRKMSATRRSMETDELIRLKQRLVSWPLLQALVEPLHVRYFP
jgi:hypothetical protein